MKHNFKKSKYNNKRTEYNGFTYDSKKEAAYAMELDLRVRAGEVLFYLKQVPFHLPGKNKYICDFQEFWTDGSVHIIDVKGVRTEVYKIKKKLVEEFYPVEIEEM